MFAITSGSQALENVVFYTMLQSVIIDLPFSALAWQTQNGDYEIPICFFRNLPGNQHAAQGIAKLSFPSRL